MNAKKFTDAWVCEDCYFAHHYGVTEHEGKWFAGESDTPSDREPLNKLEGYELADNTDSETGEGIDEFSWRSCEGCGSTLGGFRYRLAIFEKAAIYMAAFCDVMILVGLVGMFAGLGFLFLLELAGMR